MAIHKAYIANSPNWRQIPGGQAVPGEGSGPTPGVEWSSMKVIAAASDGSGSNWWQRIQELDSDLAGAVGESTPFLAGQHSYSGNNFPSTFQTSNVRNNPGYGWGYSVLNVKCDWTSLANGNMDGTINSFANSIPAGHKVYLLINHEPENDNNPAGAAVWRAGQARAANLIAGLDDPRLEFGVCHMTYTWRPASGRNPSDWNPWPQMNAAAKQRTIFAPDGYTTIRNASGTNIDTMAGEFETAFNDAVNNWGVQRLAISEHSLNNDINAPVGPIINWWQNDHLPYIRSKNLVYYAYYNSPGPASGTNSKLDTPEELDMFGNFVKEYKYV